MHPLTAGNPGRYPRRRSETRDRHAKYREMPADEGSDEQLTRQYGVRCVVRSTNKGENQVNAVEDKKGKERRQRRRSAGQERQ